MVSGSHNVAASLYNDTSSFENTGDLSCVARIESHNRSKCSVGEMTGTNTVVASVDEKRVRGVEDTVTRLMNAVSNISHFCFSIENSFLIYVFY